MRRLIAAIMIAATAAFVMATAQGASASDPVAQADFVGKINALRASQGAGQLQMHSMLTAKAEAWAAHMAATGCLCHSNLTDGISGSWSKLGENVGRGPNVASLQAAFTASPEHFANMIDKRFEWVGIGVAYGAGQMWVAEVFMDGAGPPAPSRDAARPRGQRGARSRRHRRVRLGARSRHDPTDPGARLRRRAHRHGHDGEHAARRRRGGVPGYGTPHGFSTNIGVGPGDHSVCAYAINQYNGVGNPTARLRARAATPRSARSTSPPRARVASRSRVGRSARTSRTRWPSTSTSTVTSSRP